VKEDPEELDPEAATGIGLRERKKQATARALAQAALKLAGERGVDKVRVEEIAAAADVSPRTFNNYFSSKEAAIVWPVMDRAGRIAERLRSQPPREPLAEAIRAAYAEQYVDEGGDDREQYQKMRLVISAPSLRGEYLKAAVAAERPLAEAIVGRIGDSPEHWRFARVIAASLLAAERAAVRNWAEERGATGLAGLIREAVDQVLGGTRRWPLR
jgi:AcrR family transcriptional regulator